MGGPVVGSAGGFGARVRARSARLLLRAADELEQRSMGEVRVPEVAVGPRVTIGSDVRFVADASGRAARVELGGDCWIGRGARVLAGVRIGAGAVVRPYSVVIDDVRPFAVVVGNPAVEVARRFDDATVEALVELAWWEWTDTEVAARAEDLRAGDVAAALDRLRER